MLIYDINKQPNINRKKQIQCFSDMDSVSIIKYQLQNWYKETMNKLNNFQYKNEKHNLQETNSQSDREVTCQFIEGIDIDKIRQNLNWKLLLNSQVGFNNKYLFYELIESRPHFDLYKALALSNKEKVIIKIVDKNAIRKSLTQNQFVKNSQKQYQQFLKKLKNQSDAENKLYNRLSGIFLIRPIQIYENSDCFIKITQNYYEQSLQSILKKRQCLPVHQALAVIKQIIFILFQLHKQGIILTELNPNSIIYKNGVFKISDFSSMRKVSQKFQSTVNLYYPYTYEDIIAPQLTVCPEIIDIKTQIWALGVLFYQMTAYSVPYEERETKIIKQARSHSIILELKQQDQLACEQISNLLRQMMEIDPDERISWKKLINSEILTKKQYFYSPKLFPIIDTRVTSLKKKEFSRLPQEVINNEFYQSRKNISIQTQPQSSSQNGKDWNKLNISRSFTVIDQEKKINVQKVMDLEEDTFKQVIDINLMVGKAKWIKEEIIEKLLKYEMIDSKRRSHAEMMCLLAERCNQYMRRSKMLQPQTQDARLENYLQQLKLFQNQIKQLQSTFKQKFTHLNLSPYYVSGDIFSSFVKSKNKHKNKHIFLNKEQGLDFTWQQQVKYTQQEFVNKFISQTKPKSKDQQDLLTKLKYYEKINNVSQQHLKEKFDFNEVVSEMLKIKYY